MSEEEYPSNHLPTVRFSNSNKLGVFGKRPIPAILGDAGDDVVETFLTFFTDQIRNAHTREAYLRNATAFFNWCGQHGLSFHEIESFHVSGYLEHLLLTKSDATVKQHLASLKVLFDWLVIRQMVPRNPAAAVRGPKLVVTRGKTPVIDEVTRLNGTGLIKNDSRFFRGRPIARFADTSPRCSKEVVMGKTSFTDFHFMTNSGLLSDGCRPESFAKEEPRRREDCEGGFPFPFAGRTRVTTIERGEVFN